MVLGWEHGTGVGNMAPEDGNVELGNGSMAPGNGNVVPGDGNLVLGMQIWCWGREFGA